MSLERFNKYAKQWDTKPQRVEGALIFVDAIFKELNSNIKSYHALDYGCGSGLVSFALAEHVKSINGMDYSQGMIDVYNAKVKTLNMSNKITSSIHDINIQNIEENTYDIIVTNMTMHHIKNTDMFIKKLSTGLKKGGYLCIADLETEDGTFHSDNTGVEHFGFDSNNIKELYKKHSFENLRITKLQTISKPQNNYDVFLVIGQKI
jgi:2-polyprenyl-3-methyl-5-hydroxy-6-metoxy-1,4-benzoquinol methylase